MPQALVLDTKEKLLLRTRNKIAKKILKAWNVDPEPVPENYYDPMVWHCCNNQKRWVKVGFYYQNIKAPSFSTLLRDPKKFGKTLEDAYLEAIDIYPKSQFFPALVFEVGEEFFVYSYIMVDEFFVDFQGNFLRINLNGNKRDICSLDVFLEALEKRT